MSVIETFYNNTCTIKAPATVTGSYYTGYTTVASGIKCVVMPVTELDKLYNQNNIGKEYDVYLPSDTTIKSTYILSIDGIEYGVAGISEYSDFFEGLDTHYKVRGVRK